MELLDKYSSTEIGKCEEDQVSCGDPITTEPQFIIITYTNFKKLKIDELYRELEARGSWY